MRLTIPRFITVLSISLLLIGLATLSPASADEQQSRSIVPVDYYGNWGGGYGYGNWGGYYPGCGSYYPSSEICYRWTPGYYKHYKHWNPGYWYYQRVWAPGYWTHKKHWVPGRWETRYNPGRNYYSGGYYDYGYYGAQDYRGSGLPGTAPDGGAPYGYFDSKGVWHPGKR